MSFFEKEAETPQWAMIDISKVQVERLRHFGDIYLALLLWKRLGLFEFCRAHIPAGREYNGKIASKYYSDRFT